MTRTISLMLITGLLAACGGNGGQDAQQARTGADAPPSAPGEPAVAGAPECPSGGLTLPDGFCATVYADGVGPLRHITMAPDGTLFGILREPHEGQGLVALADADGDGRADDVLRFGSISGTGILVHDGWLYASSNTDVYRWPLRGDGAVPSGEPERVVGGFPEQRSHAAKSLAIGGGRLFVNVGAPSNACMEQSRTQGSPGMDPCPQLDTQGGIWAFDAEETGQTYSQDHRYATGIRNAVALAWHPLAGELYVAQHGRDQLHQFFPDLYGTEDNAELPAEELFRVNENDDFGWPYCYYDQRRGKKVLAPEYGGDGDEVGRCAEFEDPVAVFPGHWAPNGLMFYIGDAFPERYRGGAFIAFHGSWNRAPEPQRGYKVVFVPFDGPVPAGDHEVFADGFAGREEISAPGEAEYRPMGLAQGPGGALYISDSQKGRIWRIEFRD